MLGDVDRARRAGDILGHAAVECSAMLASPLQMTGARFVTGPGTRTGWLADTEPAPTKRDEPPGFGLTGGASSAPLESPYRPAEGGHTVWIVPVVGVVIATKSLRAHYHTMNCQQSEA